MDVDRAQDTKGKGNMGKNDYQTGKGKAGKGAGKKGKGDEKGKEVKVKAKTKKAKAWQHVTLVESQGIWLKIVGGSMNQYLAGSK